jgi:hypothetical protein
VKLALAFGWGPEQWDRLDDWELDLWAAQADEIGRARSGGR